MKRNIAVFCIGAVALALSACGQQSAPPSAQAPAKKPAPINQPANPPPPKSANAVLAERLDPVLAGDWRSPENRARDRYRHPKETLTFFGLKAGQSVIEITPGAGWYTEILGPLLKDNGKLIAAIGDPNTASSQRSKEYTEKTNASYRAKLGADPTHYGAIDVREFAVHDPKFGEPNSVDVVLTFRNVHNWTMSGTDPAMFKAFFDVLKPGGVLGVVDHRAAPGADLAKIKDSGYLPQDYVIKLATDAGFRLDAKSEINANPNDTKDYPKGVWTLPPTFEEGEKDKAKYLAIGESDRMTLRFIKPGGDQIFKQGDSDKK